MKVTLINMPTTLSKYASAASAVPPVGVSYVAASLLKASHEVLVIDGIGEAINNYYSTQVDILYRGLELPEIVSRCKESDVFGVSVMFSQDWPIAKELIKLLREKFPHALLIAGGEHVTADPNGALEDCPLDYVVRGEGDHVLPELLAALSDGKKDVSEVCSVCYRKSGTIVLNPRRRRNREIGELPWPAWGLINLEPYLSEGHGNGVNRGRSMPIVASRGCPYQCTFCSSPNMWTTLWAVRPVDKVIEEIEYYIQKYQVTNIDFQDLTAIINKEWIKDFCRKLIEKKINITWQLPVGTRSEAIDGEVAVLLMQAGCKNLTYAPESGSTDTLQRIKKKIKLSEVYKSARSCIRAGIDVKFNFIFGFPEDTYESIIKSIGFIIKLAYGGVSDISISSFSPYPGSELYFQLQRQGKIKSDYYEKICHTLDVLTSESWCELIPSKALSRLQKLALIVFYLVSWMLHPTRPFKRLYNLFSGIEESRLDKALGDIKRRITFSKSGEKGQNSTSVHLF